MRRLLRPVPIAVICAVLALVALLAYGLAQNEPDRSLEDAPPAASASRRPHFELPRLTGGGRASLADYRGQVVVLNFWASWCEPCRTESPLLERWHRRISSDGGGTVLGIDGQDVSSTRATFIDATTSSPTRCCTTAPGRPARAVRRARLPRDLRDRRAGGVAAVRRGSGGRGVHARASVAPAARGAILSRARRGHGHGVRRCSPSRRRRSPPTARRTTLGDVEDEVMCPVCGTPLALATEAPQAIQQRDVHPGPDRRLPLEGRGQGGARGPVRRPGARPARRRGHATSATCSSTSSPGSACPRGGPGSPSPLGAGGGAAPSRRADPRRPQPAPPAAVSTPTSTATTCDRRRPPSTPR